MILPSRSFALLVLSCLSMTTGDASSQSLSDRTPLPKSRLLVPTLADPLASPSVPAPGRRLVIKFADIDQVRARTNGGLESAANRDIGPAQQMAARHQVQFQPLIDLPPEEVEALEVRASTRSGQAQPDLAGMLKVEFPLARGDVSAQTLQSIGNQFQDLDCVEFAYIQLLGVRPPEDIAPTTPSLTGQQTYLGVDPGIDMRDAEARGYSGSGTRISDCEYGWNGNHEELNELDLHPEPGQTPNAGVVANGWDSHGTAVAGVTIAPHNGYGVDGIAPDCQLYTFSEWTNESGFRRVACITSAVAQSSAGDIVLLEMQTGGPDGKLAPAEIDPMVFLICEVARDAGVVIVAAAGNGAANLDSSAYAAYRARGNSGAIIVGAGRDSTTHTALSFSTYGRRVDIQAWGTQVVTTGYGDLATYGGDKNQRYTRFSGTSSASAIVAGACAVLQDAAMQVRGFPLDARALRRLMRVAGHPQGTGRLIGPAIDLKAALDRLPDLALFSARNGTGINPVLYSTRSFPVLSTLWESNFNVNSSPGATTTSIYASLAPAGGTINKFGEILIDLTQLLGVHTQGVVGNTSPHVILLPSDVALIGISIFTQGVILGDELQLTNAIDLALGL